MYDILILIGGFVAFVLVISNFVNGGLIAVIGGLLMVVFVFGFAVHNCIDILYQQSGTCLVTADLFDYVEAGLGGVLGAFLINGIVSKIVQAVRPKEKLL